MTNKDLRKIIKSVVGDKNMRDNILFLDNMFADCAIGMGLDCRIIYSYKAMVNVLAESYDKKDDLDTRISKAIEYINNDILPFIAEKESKDFIAPNIALVEF